MGLTAGARIGPFVVVAPLGAGGMGEVYRARDSKLGRDVALKILPAAFAGDSERLARFEREAKTLAALNHPHIAQIHGFEEGQTGAAGDPPLHALIMELVEGEDLAQRLQRGRIPLGEAIAIASQVAEALSAAHDLGIVHRDLKPGNIRVRNDGTVKLLDFGLAKPNEPSGYSDEGLANSPTITSPAVTEQGVILGTAAYMSPEQAKGLAVDKRADAWAFGVVLYEMLSGRRPFGGSSSTEVIAQILEREPDWGAIPKETPASVQRLLRRCLQKDVRRRMRDSGDIRIELGESTIDPPAMPERNRSWTWGAVMLGIAIGVLSSLYFNSFRTASPTAPVNAGRFVLVEVPERLDAGGRLSIAISRDGRRIVYAADQRLQLRELGQLTSRPIAGTEPMATPAGERGNTGMAMQPFFSPDGESVAYQQDNQLKRVAVAGGAPTVICACIATYGASWSDDDSILFSRRSNDGSNGIWRVAAGGGEPEQLIQVSPSHIPQLPQLLPDRRHVLFSVAPGEAWDQADVVVESLATKDRRVLVDGGIDGRYASSGHLLYGKDGVINAVKFDLSTLKVSGRPAPVLPGVMHQTSAGGWGGYAYAISGSGSAIYHPAEAGAIRRTLLWVDRQGREEVLPAEARAYQYPRLSRDGRKVALDLRDQQNDVWSWDLERSTLTRVTQNRYSGGSAIWSREGDAVIYSADVGGTVNLHTQPIAVRSPRRLATSPYNQTADDLTPDGSWLLFTERVTGAGANIRRLALDGGREPEDLITTPFNERNADVSPDGRWIAYESDESGRLEVYVRPFPAVNDGRWQVSATGGSRPLWSRDGRELFFLDTARNMTAMSVTGTQRLTFGASQTLFPTASFGLEGTGRNYEISMDGKRFLMVKNLPPPVGVPSAVLIQNWFSQLPR